MTCCQRRRRLTTSLVVLVAMATVLLQLRVSPVGCFSVRRRGAGYDDDAALIDVDSGIAPERTNIDLRRHWPAAAAAAAGK